MRSLTNRHQIVIGFVLVLLVFVTREHHFSTMDLLPGASWAAFFLAGVYLRSVWVLPSLLVLTWFIDFSSYAWGGGSNYCFSPAYVFLLPAYSSLWLSGQWYAKQHQFELRTLLPLFFAVVGGSMICELFSSGGFYFFSDRFADTSFSEFGSRLVKYYPYYLQSLLFYVVMAGLVHSAITFTLGISNKEEQVEK